MSSTNENATWPIRVEATLNNAPSMAAAYEKLASPTTWKEWRSESNQTRTSDAEPLEAGSGFVFKIGCFNVTVTVNEANSKTYHFASSGQAMCGLVKANFAFDLTANDDGKVHVVVTEDQVGTIKPPTTDAVKANTLMLKELDEYFKNH